MREDATAAPERVRILVQQLAERNGQLETALRSRIVIEQAKGILAERFGLSIDDAFGLLRHSARSSRMPLHALAARVVASRETPRPIARGLAHEASWRAGASSGRAER